MKFIEIKPKDEELYVVNNFVLNSISSSNVDTLQIEFMIEEVIVNIISYSQATFIRVGVDYSNQRLTLLFVDDGIKFNPLEIDNPEMPDNIEETKVGGLGIFFIKNFASEIEYYYSNDKNHLKVTKKI